MTSKVEEQQQSQSSCPSTLVPRKSKSEKKQQATADATPPNTPPKTVPSARPWSNCTLCQQMQNPSKNPGYTSAAEATIAFAKSYWPNTLVNGLLSIDNINQAGQQGRPTIGIFTPDPTPERERTKAGGDVLFKSRPLQTPSRQAKQETAKMHMGRLRMGSRCGRESSEVSEEGGSF